MLKITVPDKLIGEAAGFYANLLGIANIPGELDIFWCDIADGAVEGYCGDAGTHYEMGVCKDPEMMLEVLAHEMVHLKQYLTGELRDVKGGTIWRDQYYKDIDNGSDAYYNLPWEREAFDKQVSMCVAFIGHYFVEGNTNVYCTQERAAGISARTPAH